MQNKGFLVRELRFVGDQPKPGGAAECLYAIVHVQFVVHIRQVEVHRALADKQRLR